MGRILSNPQRNGYLPWLKLILNVTPSLVFGIFTIIFTIQQDHFSRSTREFEQQQELQQRKQNIFDNCINTISDLLISPYFNRSDARHLRPVREKVLSALRQVDPTQKRDIIFFLYTNELITNGVPMEYRLDLTGADLTNVKFVRSSTMRCDFTKLSLRGVLASNIVFSGCILLFSDFEKSVMDRSLFENCILQANNFGDANLEQATFHQNSLYEEDFAGALLTRSTFKNNIPMMYINFTNSDLFGSSISRQSLFGTSNSDNGNSTNILSNVRFPNGSFSVDTSQLVLNNGAEDECNATSNVTKHWLLTFNNHSTQMQTYRYVINSSTYRSPIDGNCYFLAEHMSANIQPSQVTQMIDVRRFSRLIDHDQGSLSLSAHMGCIATHPNTEAVVYFGYLDIGMMPVSREASKLLKFSYTLKEPFEFLSMNASIPVGTRMIRLYMTGLLVPLINDTVQQYCMFDEIKLSIFDRYN